MKWTRRLLLAVLVGLLGLYPLLAPVAHRIDRAHADLIQAGMTREQVESIFGVPPGAYDWAEQESLHSYEFSGGGGTTKIMFLGSVDGLVRNHVVVNEVYFDLAGTKVRLGDSATWTSRNGSFIGYFDEQGRVVGSVVHYDVRMVPPWQRWWKSLRGQ